MITLTMIINKETMIDELRGAVPEFVIDPDWVPENLGYLIFNDLARYLCEQTQLSDWKVVKQGMDFLERSLDGQDPYMRDLVHEVLEALLSCDQASEVKQYFGPRTQVLWNEFMEDTYQKGAQGKDLR